ncbi:MAG: hypothetical protein V4653_16330 [Pseudomonadota bacterium]
MSWARTTLLGIAGMAGAGAFGILLRWLGLLSFFGAEMSTAEMIALVLFVLAILPTLILPLVALRRIWMGILAMVIVAITPFALAVMTKVQPFGPIPALALADARAPGGLETGIRITDAAPRGEFARRVVFGVSTPSRRGGSTTTTYTYQVAPVVHAQWVPGMPVRVWAVMERADQDPGWDSASGALFRPVDIGLAERAVRRFRAERPAAGPAVPEPAVPVIALWAADAGAARLDQVTIWAQILGGASLAWAALAWLGTGSRPGERYGSRPPVAPVKPPPRWQRRPR